ncbi:MAG: signal transduction histidine kinase [Bacillota bacterium]|nr:MAG: signal transduction histidine kinase [Bacillota bacterium]MBS3949120.1 HAMP domain-containing histidine kinase [Peptococcaceae bacterium]
MGIGLMGDFKLARRISWYNTVFALFACLLLAFSSNYLLKHHVIRTTQDELYEAATLLAQTIDMSDPIQNAIRIRTASRSVGMDIVLLNTSGRVVASTLRHFQPGGLLDVPLKDSSRLSRSERSRLQDSQHVFALAAVQRGGTKAGYILAVTQLQDLAAITRGIMSILVPVSVVVALISSMLGGIWTRKISLPLQQLNQAAHGIAAGDFQAVPTISGDDEIAELSASLRSMAGQLQAGEQAQRQFVQNASHELKTPLMNIQGYAEALRDGVYVGNEATHCLEVIGRETVRMRKLVDDMIYLSKLTSKAEAFNEESIRVGDLVQAMEESTRGILLDANLVLECGQMPDITITGDFDKLVRSFTNLIANGARYAKSTIRLAVAREANALLFEVRDDGPGIEPQLMEKVFDRFTKGSSGQTGLGLAIVKAIVERHGGSVSVRNENGAVFEVRLPT